MREDLMELLWTALRQTLYMVFWSSIFALALGIALGVALVVTGKDGVLRAPRINKLLSLLQQGLIKLKEGLTTYEATPKKIADNPLKLKFVEADSATLPRSLPDLDGAIINTNLVLEAKLDPNSALFREDVNSPYANVIVVRAGDEGKDEIKKLDAALTTPEVKQFIQDKYGVAVVPAF